MKDTPDLATEISKTNEGEADKTKQSIPKQAPFASKKAASQEKSSNKPPTNEFAKKGPLLSKLLIKRITTVIIGVALLAIGVSFIVPLTLDFFYKIKEESGKTEPDLPLEPPIINGNTETSELPVFAYIKDENSIWTANIDGQERTQLIEISKVDEEKITSTAWKNKDQISFSKCSNTNNKKGCEILLLTTTNKSQSLLITEQNSKNINTHAWGPDQKSIGYIKTTDKNLSFNLKIGTINNELETFLTEIDRSNVKSRVIFTEDNEYVIFSGIKKEIIPSKDDRDKPTIEIYPIISIYSLNGVQVDSIKNASDPFLIDNKTVGYKKDNRLMYRSIGTPDETEIATQAGFNPTISQDKKKFAFWSIETAGLQKVILQIFDSDLGIVRDVLRGIVLPTWLSDTKIAGIKVDDCLAESCLLYEFQTPGLVLINIDTSEAAIVDQGKSIANITLNNK